MSGEKVYKKKLINEREEKKNRIFCCTRFNWIARENDRKTKWQPSSARFLKRKEGKDSDIDSNIE